MSTWSLDYDHYKLKLCLSDSRVTNISKSFTHKMAQKPAGIDMERNYVTVTLCIWPPFSKQKLCKCRQCHCAISFFTDCSETSNDLSASNGILRPIQGNIDNVRKHWKVQKTECKVKPVGSPSGYSPSRLLVIVNWSVNWFACVVRRHLANRTRTQFYGPIESDKTNKNLLQRATSLEE